MSGPATAFLERMDALLTQIRDACRELPPDSPAEQALLNAETEIENAIRAAHLIRIS